MTFFQLPIGLPRVTKDGEILNSCARIGREIGSGRHGSAHEGILNGEKVCLKSYHFSWSHAFTSNPAKHEYDRLLMAREKLAEIADSIQSPIGWYKDPVIGTVLVSRLVCDYNGEPSQTLKCVSGISEAFFHQLDRVFAHFAAQEVLYNPVAANILVQRTSASDSRPVLIDLTNYESYIHYMGKGLAHFISPGCKRRQIMTWLEATRAAAQRKIEQKHPSFEEARLPPRPSTVP